MIVLTYKHILMSSLVRCETLSTHINSLITILYVDDDYTINLTFVEENKMAKFLNLG